MSVTVSLTFDTDHPKETILRAVMDAVSALTQHQPTSAYAYNSDDLDQDPKAHLVIANDGRFGGIQAAYVDQPEGAAEHAKNIRGVVVTLPIDDDFRDGS